MKKFILFPALFLLLSFLFPRTIFAQGTFKCSWPTVGVCGGHLCCSPSNVSCQSGYTPIDSFCNSITDSALCNSAPTQTCNKVGVSGGTLSNWGLRCKNNQNAINTAIGCIPFDDLTAFGSFFLKWAVGIGGGIAFLLIIYAGFMILTSAGNPEKIKAGQELMTSAIGGLLLLIFSVFILKLIGVDILRLPI